MFTLRASLLLSAASRAISQFVPAPTDLLNATGFLGLPVRFKEVPTGICELDPNVKSYSGYVDVSEDEHIFFWFFEARNTDPSQAPLTAWINGGPGSSSMIGIFEGNGPCSIDIDGKVHNNPYSFIRLPDATCPDYARDIGTCGTYSYPNLTLTADTTRNAAPKFWKTLQGFMGAFPQYSRNAFHFATESYGGLYGPIFSEYIKAQNALNISGAQHISLESLSIGNGWFDSLIQHQANYNFTVYPGNTYDYSPFNAQVQSQLYNNLYGPGNCVDQIKDCVARGISETCWSAEKFCTSNVGFMFDKYSDRNEYDVRELIRDRLPYSPYISYLNRAEVRAAIGAFQNFAHRSLAVYQAFTLSGDVIREYGSVSAVRKLVEQDITGTRITCNWLGVEAVADEVNPPGFSSAGYANLTTSDNQVHGQVKQAGKFSFVRVYESGHDVSLQQPLAALEIFERAINGKDIAVGSQTVGPGFITKGTKKSEYREGSSSMHSRVPS
ncbi:alpha/beta-hydrolase [Diplocarpon rosae]|nr:alpha/beta-hydrolase [Diplocarpon rosae]